MANTLAYYDTATIIAVKSFIVQAPGPNVTRLFSLSMTKRPNEPDTVFVPDIPF